jgi:hypothetical protein
MAYFFPGRYKDDLEPDVLEAVQQVESGAVVHLDVE